MVLSDIHILSKTDLLIESFRYNRNISLLNKNMTERSLYANLNRNELRKEIARRKLPGKGVSKASLIAILVAADENGKLPEVNPSAETPSRNRVVAVKATPPERKLEVNQKGLNYQLIKTVTTGNFEMVERMIRNGAEVEATDDEGRTALMWATSGRDKEIVEMLIKEGADVNATTDDGWTALMYAALVGWNDITKVLINNGAKVNVANQNGQTALMMAAQVKSRVRGWPTLELLIEAGADIKMKDNRGFIARDFYKGNKEEFDAIVKDYALKI